MKTKKKLAFNQPRWRSAKETIWQLGKEKIFVILTTQLYFTSEQKKTWPMGYSFRSLTKNSESCSCSEWAGPVFNIFQTTATQVPQNQMKPCGQKVVSKATMYDDYPPLSALSPTSTALTRFKPTLTCCCESVIIYRWPSRANTPCNPHSERTLLFLNNNVHTHTRTHTHTHAHAHTKQHSRRHNAKEFDINKPARSYSFSVWKAPTQLDTFIYSAGVHWVRQGHWWFE